MEYNIPNIDEILIDTIEFRNLKTGEIKKVVRYNRKNIIIKQLKNILPLCKYYEINIDNFLLIAYNNIITQLTIIIENYEKNFVNINLKHLHHTNNIKKEFYKLCMNLYMENTSDIPYKPFGSIETLYTKDIITYGDILTKTAYNIYYIIFDSKENLDLYFKL
jgi:hypothetical protein